MKKIILMLFLSITATAVLQAQKTQVILKDKAGWHKIGEAKVEFKTETDAFLILGRDKYRAVQVRVKDAPIYLENMTIEYDNGETQVVDLKHNYAANSKTTVIDVKDNAKGLKKVSFVYKTVANAHNEKAEIELWGLK
jgi:hypothetical protein